jgi:hypothetical protein
VLTESIAKLLEVFEGDGFSGRNTLSKWLRYSEFKSLAFGRLSPKVVETVPLTAHHKCR